MLYPSRKGAVRYLLLRENAGTSVAGNNLAIPQDDSEDDAPSGKKGGGFSAFAALGIEDTAQDEEEDFGGLMVRPN